MPHGDAGVSPVIGFVLVLGISLAGIVVVSLWAVPLLESTAASQDHQAVVSSLSDLARQFRNVLTTGTPDTSAEATIHHGGGTVVLQPAIWGVAASLSPSVDLTYGSLEDGDSLIKVKNADESAVTLSGYARQYNATAYKILYPCIGLARMLSSSIPPGGFVSVTFFTLADCTGAVTLGAGPILVNFTSSGSDVALLAFGDVRKLEHEFQVPSGGSYFSAVESGGVAVKRGGWYMEESPTVSFTNTATVRTALLTLPVITSAPGLGGGAGNQVVKVSLEKVWSAYSSTSAQHVRVYPPAASWDAWERGMTSPAGPFTSVTDTVDGVAVKNLYQSSASTSRVGFTIAFIKVEGLGVI